MARLSQVLIAAAAALLGMIGPAAAQAAVAAPHHHPIHARRATGTLAAPAIVPHHPPIHVLNATTIHAAFEKALRSHPRIGNIAYTRPRGYKGPAVKLTAGCTEPNCPLSYGGGPVQVSGRDVYLVFWGPKWSSTGPDTTYTSNFFSGLGTTSDGWLPITQQYTQNGCCDEEIQLGKSILSSPGGIFSDKSAPPSTVTPADLAAEDKALVTSGALGSSPPKDALVILAAQTGTCFSDGFAGQPASCSTQPSKSYCAWHSDTSFGSPSNSYAFINLPYQLDAGGSCGENFINSGSAGTYDGFSVVGGHELAESFSDPQVGSGWNDSASGGGEIGDKCAWRKPPAGDITLSTGTFAMQGLWSNADNKCMLLNDQQTGFISGIHSMCVDDAGGSLTNGNKVQVWACNGGSNQVWSTPKTGKTGQVMLHGTGSCLDVHNDTNANGTKIQLWQCLNDASQQWTPESNGTLVHAGFCLDDPNGTTTGGTQLQIWSCDGFPQQQWSPGHQ